MSKGGRSLVLNTNLDDLAVADIQQLVDRTSG